MGQRNGGVFRSFTYTAAASAGESGSEKVAERYDGASESVHHRGIPCETSTVLSWN